MKKLIALAAVFALGITTIGCAEKGKVEKKVDVTTTTPDGTTKTTVDQKVETTPNSETKTTTQKTETKP